MDHPQMPWSLQIASKDKQALLDRVASDESIPKFVVSALRDVMTAMPDGVGLNVITAGYLQPEGGLVEIKVHMMNVL